MTEANRAQLEDRPEDALGNYTAAAELCRRSGARGELIRALKGMGQIEGDMNRGGAAVLCYAPLDKWTDRNVCPTI